MFRAPNAFTLLSDANLLENDKHRIDIKDINLTVTRHRLVDDIAKAIYAEWNLRPIPYHFKRITPMNVTEITTDTLQVDKTVGHGQRPMLMFCMFVESEAMRGDLSKNPLFLRHLNVTECSVVFEGKRYPTNPIKCDFPSTVGDNRYDCTQVYVNFLRALGLYTKNAGNGLDLDDYVGGNCCFGFVLSENEVLPGLDVASPETGYTSVHFTFAKKPSFNAQLWTFGVFSSTVRLTRDSIVMSDYIAGSGG